MVRCALSTQILRFSGAGLVLVGLFCPLSFSAARVTQGMIRAVCDQGQDVRESGCAQCPDYMLAGSDPELTGSLKAAGLDVAGVIKGSFTGLHQQQAFVTTRGCFIQADGFESAVLLQRQDGADSWNRIGFFHNPVHLPLGACYRLDGGDREPDDLLCEDFNWNLGQFNVFGFLAGGQMTLLKQLLVERQNEPLRAEDQQQCFSVRAQPGSVLTKHEIEMLITYYYYTNPNEGPCGSADESKLVHERAVFLRRGQTYVPDSPSLKVLADISQIPY
jgi:hypothetical protein